ncbi:hypothetical protein RGCCGE502_20450 [Rhizobium grahamii CCGE 502]|uniref:Uncharacterized protein n=1 Tax=Rhizobium grahamii CCGE 502 TaxID=990285 RepID=S3HDZ9_9HYPH|nr:hypothetical protein RGCCGE502_20450 [Rhizobium grahamii CCGE 502]
MRKINANEEYFGSSVANESNLLRGVVFKRVDAIRSNRARNTALLTDFSFVKVALKVLCRENSISHDRKASVEIAALLVALVREGAHCEKELIDGVRQRWSPLRIQ